MVGLLFGPLVLLTRRRERLTPPAPPFSLAILVTSYNEEATIDECLASLRHQIPSRRHLGKPSLWEGSRRTESGGPEQPFTP